MECQVGHSHAVWLHWRCPASFWPLCQWGKYVTARGHGLYCWNLASKGCIPGAPSQTGRNHLERSVPLSLPPRVVQTELRLPLDRVPSNTVHYDLREFKLFNLGYLATESAERLSQIREAQPAASRPRRCAYELISYSIVSLFVCQPDVLIFARIATGLCSNADKHKPTATKQLAGAWTCHASHSYHIHPHYKARYGQPRRFLCVFLDCICTCPTSISPLSAEVDSSKLTLPTAMLSENAISGDLPYPSQHHVEFNEHNFSHMAIFSCRMTNAEGWYINESNSQYVTFLDCGLCPHRKSTIVVGARNVLRFEFEKARRRQEPKWGDLGDGRVVLAA